MRIATIIEIGSLIPITLYLGPLLTFGTAMFLVSASLTLMSQGGSRAEFLGFAGLILWLLAGLYGLVMVWVVTIESARNINLSPRQRALRIGGLLMGAAAAGLWFYASADPGASWNNRNAVFWDLLFLPPTTLGLWHGLRLLRGPASKQP